MGVSIESVKLGNGAIESGLGQVAGLLCGIPDLIVENAVVNGQA